MERDVEICKNSISFIDVAFFPSLLFFAYRSFHDVFEKRLTGHFYFRNNTYTLKIKIIKLNVT